MYLLVLYVSLFCCVYYFLP